MKPTIRLSARESIIEASFVLFSHNIGASLSEVAERAGVGRATLHRQFANRDDLLRTLARLAIAEMNAAADAASADAKSYSEALRATLYALIPLGDRHGFLAREPLEADPDLAKEFERLDQEMNELLEAAKGEGLFDTALPTPWISQVFDSLLFTAWESVKLGHTTTNQAADLAWLTLTQGLGAKKK